MEASLWLSGKSQNVAKRLVVYLMLLGSSRPYPSFILEENGRWTDDDDDDDDLDLVRVTYIQLHHPCKNTNCILLVSYKTMECFFKTAQSHPTSARRSKPWKIAVVTGRNSSLTRSTNWRGTTTSPVIARIRVIQTLACTKESVPGRAMGSEPRAIAWMDSLNRTVQPCHHTYEEHRILIRLRE